VLGAKIAWPTINAGQSIEVVGGRMTAPNTFILWLDRNLGVVKCNRAFGEAVGLDTKAEPRIPLTKFVSQRDRRQLLAWLRLHEADDDGAPSIVFNFLGKDRKYIPVEASCLVASLPDGQYLALSAQLKTNFDVQFEAVERENEFLRRVIEASVEAMWCIEFQEPVDLLEDEDEVVRQVFENRCSWRLCNKAMARLYNIPGNADLNEIPVRKNFPRSRANERYIRALIRERFNVDSALSIDIKYDGEAIYGDNSVRGDIVDDKLLRFWGTMHDVTGYRKLQAQMNREQRSLQNILAAIPEAVLVVGKDLRLKGANPAFETLVHHSIDFALGKKVEDLFRFGQSLSELERSNERAVVKCEVRSRSKTVKPRSFAAWVVPMSGNGAGSDLIITLRPMEPFTKARAQNLGVVS
jgi:PAS domain-containing protein